VGGHARFRCARWAIWSATIEQPRQAWSGQPNTPGIVERRGRRSADGGPFEQVAQSSPLPFGPLETHTFSPRPATASAGVRRPSASRAWVNSFSFHEQLLGAQLPTPVQKRHEFCIANASCCCDACCPSASDFASIRPGKTGVIFLHEGRSQPSPERCRLFAARTGRPGTSRCMCQPAMCLSSVARSGGRTADG